MAGKVLYVINGFNSGGAEIGFKTMLEHGFLSGCEVRVLAIHEGVPEVRRQVAALLPPGALTVVSEGRKLTVGRLVKAFFALRQLITEFRPDTAILSLKQANILGRLILASAAVHRISFEHIVKLERGLLAPVYTRLLHLLSPRIDEVWADCRATLVGVRAYYQPKARIERVVPLFVVPGAAPNKDSYARGAGLRLATAGRLVPRKRVDILIEAIARLRADGVAATLTVFGDGPERPRLERLAQDRGVAGSVSFRGFQPAWYAQAVDHDIFAHLSDEEGFCVVVAEAMMVGLPVITNPVGGVGDYSSDGVDARHVAAPEVVAVAAAVRELADDEGRRAALGRAAAERMRRHYGRQAVEAALAEVTSALRQRDSHGE